MNNSKGYIAKMSESNILNQYSNYLQDAYVHLDNEKLISSNLLNGLILTYDEFKEYYIMDLVGKDSFVDNLVYDLQFGLR